MKKYIIALDIGTTAVKTTLFDEELNFAAVHTEEYPLITASNGFIECEPRRYTEAAARGIKAVLESAEGEVAAIGITTQGETLMPIDKDGNPLSNAVVWLDSRAEKQAERLSEKIDGSYFYSRTGLPEINGALPICKLMWFKDEKPEIYEKTDKFLLVEDYIIYWLCGEKVSEKALQCSTGWFDIISDGNFDEVIAAAEIDGGKLPDVLSCGETVGRISKIAAEELGISENAAVVTGAMDQTAAALGAGVVGAGKICETTGTALVMAAYTDKPDFSQKSRVTIYRHAVGGYLYLPIGNTGGRALTWFRDNFAKELTYQEMDCLAEQISAGSDGLITLPYLAGCVNPDNIPNARAVFFGADLNTSRPHFIRSIMESIGFSLRDFLEMLESLGVCADKIYSLGGGSKSAVWQQIKADICSKSFVSVKNGEIASLGAAILAAKGIGLCVNLNESENREYIPNPDNRDVYEKSYSNYRRLYDAIKPLY